MGEPGLTARNKKLLGAKGILVAVRHAQQSSEVGPYPPSAWETAMESKISASMVSSSKSIKSIFSPQSLAAPLANTGQLRSNPSHTAGKGHSRSESSAFGPPKPHQASTAQTATSHHSPGPALDPSRGCRSRPPRCRAAPDPHPRSRACWRPPPQPSAARARDKRGIMRHPVGTVGGWVCNPQPLWW